MACFYDNVPTYQFWGFCDTDRMYQGLNYGSRSDVQAAIRLGCLYLASDFVFRAQVQLFRLLRWAEVCLCACGLDVRSGGFSGGLGFRNNQRNATTSLLATYIQEAVPMV